ncbi:efflux RND transporter permease subunit [Rhodocaloribacter litoris]|uniref:efflux RND transporter permease subunit n=1 Tax=Rhodocaloribacter litoris TaxID=2558931 RepID=UPI001421E36F|nr:efflux RND transporter permease subunit [Rhodocaloribacter litoris]QXD14675.1 efflux RND transporter permease subunit [Rhodocaloribacter litoris]
MASLTNLSIRRPVATAMFYLVVITLGIVGFLYLPVDLLPPIEFTRMTVYTRYPNVGPEEIEQIITDPIENAVSGLPNLERISSRSQEGVSFVSLEFARGTSLDEAANDLRAALDRIRDDLPPEAEPPGIWKFDPNNISIVTLAVESRRNLEELTRILERDLAQRFEQIPGVGTIEVRGGIYREIQVNLERDRLQASGLTPSDVQQALARENMTLPGGNVKEGVRDLYVRSRGEFTSLDQIRNTIITTVGEKPVRVRDVAEVVDGYEDIDRLTELNGMPVILLNIQKQSGANTVTVAEAIQREVDRINAERNDLRIHVISDQSTFIRQSISNVQSSAIWGGLLAILVLYLFLRNGSSTFIIALAIPISVIATFGLLYFGGMTLNQMTFGGLALGIGLMVDNAIVVLENIVRHREEKGATLMEAARIGTREVAGAIVASTLTTCVIFLPLVFMRSTTGDLFQALAVVVVFALGCSLLVALTLVPVLASRFLTVSPRPGKEKAPAHRSRFRRLFEALEHRYSHALKTAVAHRYVVLGCTGVLLLGTVLAWPLIPVELAPPVDADEIGIDLEMAQGTNIAVVKEYLDELERVVRPLLPEDDVVNVVTEVRGGDAEIEIRLKPAGERRIDSAVLAEQIRRQVDGLIPGAELRVDAGSALWILRRIFSSGDGTEAVQVELRGYDLEQADALARQIQQRMETLEGVTGVRLSRREGRPEENIVFDREKIASLGLTVQEVARAIQTSIGGSRAGQFRAGGDEFPITVRFRPKDRLTLLDLDDIAVRTPAGALVPVASLVRNERGRAPTTIQRINGQRVTYISANLAPGVALGDAVERIRQELARIPLPDGFSITFGGEYEEQQKAERDFLIAILMALVLIYMVMAGQFERFLDPLIVMCSVPVAIVGVVPALLLTGTTLNMQSVMGMVMLVGIVVNNAIVLVDYINLLRREHGLDVLPAVVEAGRLRLRPILMTTLTTTLGLLPLALGFGAGAELQAPLARVVIGGLLASTLITLVLIPVVYVGATAAAARARAFVLNLRGASLDPATRPSS